jgi:hypothetical protein
VLARARFLRPSARADGLFYWKRQMKRERDERESSYRSR